MAPKSKSSAARTSSTSNSSRNKESGRTSRRIPSRLVKRRLVRRILKDTEAVRSGSLVDLLRKQGYDQVPLDELQDRLSKLPTSLADFILKGRG
ncbi:MAG: hypothetical protein AB1555_05825 [Nitrospirota bacterium]